MVKSEVQEDGSTSTKELELDDPATTSDTSHPSYDDDLASVGVSKWQLKGKRNTRTLTKRFVDTSGGKNSRNSNQGTKSKGKRTYGCEEMDLFDKKYGTRIGLDGNITSSEDLTWNTLPVSKGLWGDFIEYEGGDRRKRMLVEVDLKVQSNYQREHVPMISLMSKLNGQAIVGHPIQIETLEYGSSKALLAIAADNELKLNLDNDTSLPPMWRTARRTANCRVPRPCSSAMVDGDGDEGVEHLQHCRKGSTNKSNGGIFSHKTSMVSKISAHGSHKMLFKKPGKKTIVVSNQKTRTLASIATQQKATNHLKESSTGCHVNGLVKSEPVPTAVACIPIKLVFSRLHEELVGHHQ